MDLNKAKIKTVQNAELKPPVLIDAGLVIAVFALVILSLVMIYSTTALGSMNYYDDPLFYIKRQGVAVFIGLSSLFLMTKVRVSSLRQFSSWGLLLAFLIILLTFVPGLGKASGGASRWIVLPFFNFQPAEISKILFVVFLSGYFVRQQEKLGSYLHGVILPYLFAVLLAAVLLKQPDFGSTAIIFMVCTVMILAVGVKLRYLILTAIPIICGAALLILQSPYRMKRVMVFLSPADDVQGAAYQLNQSLIAVSNGGISGLGLGDSMQKLKYLPAAHTDFIYAMISEELGLIGAISVLLLFLYIMRRGFKISRELIPDLFSYSLAVGLTMLIVAPGLINIGVVIGMLPTKGLVMPLVGYGGSSMISSLIIVGLLLALAKHRFRQNF